MKQVNKQNRAMTNKINGLPENYSGEELTEEQAAEMEKRSELAGKVSEYTLEMIQTFKPIIMNCENEINSLSNEIDNDPAYDALYNKLNNIQQDETDFNNHTATLAAINKYNREYHAIYSQIAAKKINQNLDILKNTYNKLKPHQNKLIEMDEAFVKHNKNMQNGMENINDVREMLIEIAKMYKTAIEENTPQPLKQYKTWEEYETEGMN